MNPDRLAEAESIFQEVADLSPGDRGPILSERCGDDAELRLLVDRLLAHHDGGMGSFLESPSQDIRATIDPRDTVLPSRIGPYRILEAIGEGGMGMVYIAEQTKPVRRKVALKVIKPGMDSQQVIARFEAERQALVLMDHASIARVLDAGETDQGRPYFAMDLIKGEPITEYCDRHTLSTKERLDLFVPVCRAVQHAHQKGIIHRDLKPSNILVTMADGKPVPKVIDFGIAKAVTGALAERTLHTQQGQLIGTPAYMSPEQAEMSGLDVDTRTDIYSLGVILYELLSGEIARRHRTDPRTLARQLRGELDWIILKAMEKDRARRYETPNSLAMDIGRYLADEPVLAGPPSAVYRFRKFAKRNKVAIAVAVVILMTVIVALIQSNIQRARVQAAHDESEAVIEFLEEMLASVDPGEHGPNVTVREILDKAAETIEERFADQPLIEARLRHTMAEAYVALYQSAAAEPHVTQAIEIRRRLLGPEHLETLRSRYVLAYVYGCWARSSESISLLHDLIETQRRVLGEEHPETLRSSNLLARIYGEQGWYAEADSIQRRILGIWRRLEGEDHPQTLREIFRVALVSFRSGRYAEAESLYARALEGMRRVLGEEDPFTLDAMHGLALAHIQQGFSEKADTLLLQTLQAMRRVRGEAHAFTLGVCKTMAWQYQVHGRYAEAESLWSEILETARPAYGDEHHVTLHYLDRLATVYRLQGRYAEAEPLYREAVEGFLRLPDPAAAGAGLALSGLVALLLETDRSNEARPFVVELAAIRKRAAEEPYASPDLKNQYAGFLLTCEPPDLRDPQVALQFALEANEMTGFENPNYLDTLALAYHLTGQAAKAIDTQKKAIPLLQHTSPETRAEIEERLAVFEKAARSPSPE
jgi:non-specific serine/threonine protein kinase/serine/threonine-protein kinase